MKRNSTLLFILVSSLCFVHTQTLKKEFPSEQQIDVIENLGEFLPLNIPFIDENGEEVELSSFFTKDIPTVLTLNYFECPMLCTLVLNGLAESLRNLTLNAGDDFQIITIDINPNEQTLFANQKKKNYIKGFGLEKVKNDWHFLTGDQENIKKVADSIGYIYYYDNQRNEYMHPAAITLLSSEAKISRYLYGIEYPVKDLKLGILEASEGKIRSTIDKIILYCYHYDPYKNTYTIFATNVMRLGGIFTILFIGLMLITYWKNDRNLFDKDSLNAR